MSLRGRDTPRMLRCCSAPRRLRHPAASVLRSLMGGTHPPSGAAKGKRGAVQAAADQPVAAGAESTPAPSPGAGAKKRRVSSSPKAPPPVPTAEQVAKAARIRGILAALYPPPLTPPLAWKNHFELLCSVVLSAQTTDKKVNECTPALFAAAPTPQVMAALPVPVIEGHIKQLGLAPSKAVYLSQLSAQLVERHGGVVPGTFEALEALSGVGHKTASVVLSHAFGLPTFPVDTHIHRLAVRWGLCVQPKATVVHVERDLKALFPESCWGDVHLQLIFFGREHCPATKSHDTAKCPICSWAAVPPPEEAAPAAASPAAAA